MKPIAEIVQFQKQQQAKFICSRCGADRGCDCNAPAVEKLAEMKEQARQRDRAYKERKRKQIQRLSDVADDDWTDEEIEAEVGPLPSKEQKIRDDFIYLAGIAQRVTLLDLANVRITAEMKQAAKAAAETWSKISKEVNHG